MLLLKIYYENKNVISSPDRPAGRLVEGKIPCGCEVRTTMRIWNDSGIIGSYGNGWFCSKKKYYFCKQFFCSYFGTTLNHNL